MTRVKFSKEHLFCSNNAPEIHIFNFWRHQKLLLVAKNLQDSTPLFENNCEDIGISKLVSQLKILPSLFELKGTLMQIWKIPYMLVCSYKINTWKFCIPNPKNSRIICLWSFSHISCVHISKSKWCFNYYFHMNTKILTNFQICISAPLKIMRQLPWARSLTNCNIYHEIDAF